MARIRFENVQYSDCMPQKSFTTRVSNDKT